MSGSGEGAGPRGWGVARKRRGSFRTKAIGEGWSGEQRGLWKGWAEMAGT